MRGCPEEELFHPCPHGERSDNFPAANRWDPAAGRPVERDSCFGARGRWEREVWQLRAACRGPDSSLFFPPSHFERKDKKEFREEDGAKAICKTCVVRRECLDYTLRIREPHGIWGGLNEIERKTKLSVRAG